MTKNVYIDDVTVKMNTSRLNLVRNAFTKLGYGVEIASECSNSRIRVLSMSECLYYYSDRIVESSLPYMIAYELRMKTITPDKLLEMAMELLTEEEPDEETEGGDGTGNDGSGDDISGGSGTEDGGSESSGTPDHTEGVV